LYLHVSPTGAKSWIFRFTRKLGGEKPISREIGLGPLHIIGLADAREIAKEYRALLHAGIDPLLHRQQIAAARLQQTIADALEQRKAGMTFAACVQEYIAAKAGEWDNPKHKQQWENTLSTYAGPVIGSKPVAEIDINDVHAVFTRADFWAAKTETAQRTRQRIEAVLSWATAKQLRSGDNPAAWDKLQHLLADPAKIKKVRPMPSLPYAQVPAFIKQLRLQGGIAARALEFAILCASRPGEVVGATWSEVDADVWTIPAGRMKKRKEHRVPLCDRALEILAAMKTPDSKPGDLIFPSSKPGKPMSDMTISATIKRMNNPTLLWFDPKLENAAIVPHGFRSSFSTYVAEETQHPADIREACLAHAIKNKVIEAYQRGDLLQRRRALMQDWCTFCEGAAK
jgi:integrase